MTLLRLFGPSRRAEHRDRTAREAPRNDELRSYHRTESVEINRPLESAVDVPRDTTRRSPDLRPPVPDRREPYPTGENPSGSNNPTPGYPIGCQRPREGRRSHGTAHPGVDDSPAHHPAQ